MGKMRILMSLTLVVVLTGSIVVLAFADGCGTISVQKGEGGYAVARRIGVSFTALQAANPGVNLGNLRVGQVLSKPCGSAPALIPTPGFTSVEKATGGMVGPISWSGTGEKMVARYNHWTGDSCYEMKYYDGAWRFWSTVQISNPPNGTLVQVYPASHPGWYAPKGWVVQTASNQYYYCTGKGHLVPTTSGYKNFTYNEVYGGRLNGFKVKVTSSGMWVEDQFIAVGSQVSFTVDGVSYTMKVSKCWHQIAWFAWNGAWFCSGVVTWE